MTPEVVKEGIATLILVIVLLFVTGPWARFLSHDSGKEYNKPGRTSDRMRGIQR